MKSILLRLLEGAKGTECCGIIIIEFIYVATANKYGDPLGPTFEQLAERKTYAEIIESSSRPIEDLDNRLTVDGFIEWYKQKKSE